MKKKIVALCLIVALAVTAITGATLAYFTDTDKATNTMTVGNVAITQNETKKDGTAYVDGLELVPMVDNREDGAATTVDGYFNEAMANVIDKVVTVTNDGSKPAYVRTILAFETARHYAEGSSTEFTDMHDTYIGVLGDFEYTTEYVTIDGTEYVLAVKVYEDALASGATSEPSLKQFFLAPTAGNEVSTIFGNDYKILALSQGVQTDGFTSAEDALNTAFGEVTAENFAAWMAE